MDIEMRALAAVRNYYIEHGWLEDAADAETYKHNSFALILRCSSEAKHVEVKGPRSLQGHREVPFGRPLRAHRRQDRGRHGQITDGHQRESARLRPVVSSRRSAGAHRVQLLRDRPVVHAPTTCYTQLMG